MIDHKRQGSVIGGNATVAGADRSWTLNFLTEASPTAKTVKLTASVRDLIPKHFAPALPEFALLSPLEMPVNGNADIELSSDGELLGGTFTLALQPGIIRLNGSKPTPLTLDNGRIEMRYQRDNRRLEISPATFQWGQSRIAIEGLIVPEEGHAGGSRWTVDLTSREGVLAAEEFSVPPVPIENARLQGAFLPASGTFEFTEIRLKAGGAEMVAAGRVGDAGGTLGLAMEGRFGTIPLAALKALWPRALAPEARRWVGRNVHHGRVTTGTFGVYEPAPPRTTATAPRTSLSIEATDVKFVPRQGLLPIDVPRALVRFDNGNLEIAAPEAFIALKQGRQLVLRSGKMISNDVGGPLAFGDLTFRAQGTAAAVIDYLDQDAFKANRPGAFSGDGIEGRAEAEFKLTIPIGDALTAQDLKIDGKGRLTDGRAKGLFGGFDVQGATIGFDISDQSIDAKGEMLVAGVPAKLSWQKIFGADAPPALRINATLDGSDRTQLGLDINDILQGELPIQITVTPQAGREQPLVQVRGDLTNAEIVLESLVWKKPTGRPAYVEFEVAKSQRHKTELQGFKVGGDDIAIEGTIGIDTQNRLREFNFPTFSLKTVSRLTVGGVLRPNNIWDVNVKGATFDGRDFFQSLFSVGQLRDKPLPVRKDAPGLDLKAEIANVIGFSELSLKGLTMSLSKRAGQMTALAARGNVEGGDRPPRLLEVGLQQTSNTPRTLVARSDDAGQVFRLVGFFSNVHSGRMRLDVNLDGRGPAEKTGVLIVERFAILGDPVVFELTPSAEGPKMQQRRVTREVLEFDWMRAPFSVGHGQFVLEDGSELRGPVLGVSIKGKADFRTQFVSLGGTYTPLQGLNAAVGVIPGIGQLLTGPNGEGVFGIKFAIQGPMARPQMIVNPLSLAAPGIFRELFDMTPQTPRVTPRDNRAPAKTGSGAGPATRSYSTIPPGGPAAVKGEPRVDADGGWTMQATPAVPAPKSK